MEYKNCISTTNNTTLKAVDFFCGGGGMTCGLRQAGIDVIAGVDFDKSAKDTYEFNNPGSKFIHTDIKELPLNYFERPEYGIGKDDDNLIFVGCSPCQFYSIINTSRTKSQQSKDLLMSFANFIEYYKPGFVLVENVPGILTNKASIWDKFLHFLDNHGYQNKEFKVIDLSYYGVPQSRKRFSMIATRIKNTSPIHLPQADNKRQILEDFIGPKNGFCPIPAGYKDSSSFNHSSAGLDKRNLERLSVTPHNGGSRLCWASRPDLQLRCYIGHDDIFKDNYGRMSWNKPAPTITTKFFNISNGRFAHPEEDRAISIREGATLQTFPLNYDFKTSSLADAAKLIGNAVPCEYARRLGVTIQVFLEQYHGAIQN